MDEGCLLDCILLLSYTMMVEFDLYYCLISYYHGC